MKFSSLITLTVLASACSGSLLVAQELPVSPRPQQDRQPAGERGRPSNKLDGELLAKLRKVMKAANQAPQVLAARKEAKSAANTLGKMIRDRGGERAPDLAKKLNDLGFEWLPPRRRGNDPDRAKGPRQAEQGQPLPRGPRDPKLSPDRARVLDQLTPAERQQLRQLVRDLMAEPEIRRQRRVADEKWESFKKVLRAEVGRLDPDVVRELEKQRPNRGRRARPEGPRPQR